MSLVDEGARQEASESSTGTPNVDNNGHAPNLLTPSPNPLPNTHANGQESPKGQDPAFAGPSEIVKDTQETSNSEETQNASTRPVTPPSALNGMSASQQKTQTHVNGAKSSKNARPSFLSRLIHILVPCISPSPSSHPVELPESVPQIQTSEKVGTKVEEDKVSPVEVTTAPEPPRPEPLSPLVVPESRPITPSGEDTEVILPPTPTTHLLPPDETEGMTSGAVQPPGSKGESPTHEKHHHAPHTNSDPEDSEGTSYEEELEDVEDEEDRLIFNGGAGIPIGPVSEVSSDGGCVYSIFI